MPEAQHINIITEDLLAFTRFLAQIDDINKSFFWEFQGRS